jgi:hypothetical protein
MGILDIRISKLNIDSLIGKEKVCYFTDLTVMNGSHGPFINQIRQIVDRLQEFSDSRTESVDNIYISPIRFAPSGEDALMQGIWSFKNRYLLKS